MHLATILSLPRHCHCVFAFLVKQAIYQAQSGKRREKFDRGCRGESGQFAPKTARRRPSDEKWLSLF
jgi:hypothetical protein